MSGKITSVKCDGSNVCADESSLPDSVDLFDVGLFIPDCAGRFDFDCGILEETALTVVKLREAMLREQALISIADIVDFSGVASLSNMADGGTTISQLQILM